ncbi:MAG: flp pilus-assembly TadE/G-like family protein, partial [Planctomycetota bacterium]
MRKFLRRLAVEEKGQGLLFGVVSLFILCLCTAMVYNLGQVTNTRTRVQSAADSAALSGALVEADIGSSIAWMNDGMAYVYYHLMRYAVDVIVY